ncbi:Leucine Rich Repeat [Seminavis robusta]|uniref:Leucine Rich Repeat n=1 Tax=Seminavis robusta TaxID=568900 RepID=A0A9N8EWR9_9STRA|nr:Leucine Rich Repeat [Seminavis robusta]|eukprot:Sro2250_g320820.1 Leucine Rich Repeat (362) ;mRNA; r:10956-12512
MTRQPSESFHDGGTCTVSPNLDRGEDPLPEATCTVSSTEQQTTPSASIIQTATCTADDWESNPKHNTSSQKQHQDETKNTQDDAKRRQFWIWGLGLILLVIIIIVIAIIAGVEGGTNDKKDEDNQETPPPPTTGITDPSSPQARTQQWLDGYPNYASLPKWRRDQLRGLALFYYSFHGDTWPGPKWTSKQTPWLDYSSDDVECIWYSASFAHSNCNHLGQFTSLVLKDLKLANHHQEEEEVTIPTEMLWWLALNDNQLSSAIPTELGNLSGLQILSLQSNHLISGTIPVELGNATKLAELELSNLPMLTGTIPPDLWTQLSSLNLEGSVGVTGTIPTSSCERVRFDCSNALCGCDCPCSAA